MRYHELFEGKTRLDELANNPAPFELKRADDDLLEAEFKIDGVTYCVDGGVSERLHDGHAEKCLEVEFYQYDSDSSPHIIQKITGTGNSVAVFSTVAAILNEYLYIQSDVNLVRFGSTVKEPSRVKLYRKLFANIKAYVRGFSPSSFEEQQHYVFFTIVRDEAPQQDL